MVLGILGLAAMILCWAAGSYWKKVYYINMVFIFADADFLVFV